MKPALFLHIQKTAGTSVQEMARRQYGNDQVLSHADYIALGVEGCRDKAFVSGHFGIEFARQLIDGRYSFTFLRDPYQRLFSLYRYCRSRTDIEGDLYEAARKHDVEGFLRASLDSDQVSHVWNNQVWQLSYGFGSSILDDQVGDIKSYNPDHLLELAKANLAIFDRVGLVETFDEDIRKIFSDLGRAKVEIQQSNVTEITVSEFEVSDRLGQLMDECTVLDRALYQYALQLRSGRVKMLLSRLAGRRAKRA